MKNDLPFGTLPPETVILKLSPAGTLSTRQRFLDQIYTLFSRLNWRAHIYILNGDPENRLEGFFGVGQLARKYLESRKFCTLYLHPVFMADDFSSDAVDAWHRILALPAEFAREAYREQGKERLIILPVLKLDPSLTSDEVTTAARFFQNRQTKPSLYFAAEPPFDCMKVLGEDIRVYVDEFSDLSDEMVAAQLGANHIFEDLLERADGPLESFLNPCRRHLIVSEADWAVYACFRQLRKGESCAVLESIFDDLPTVDVRQCAGCIPDSFSLMEGNFHPNRRLEEGAQVCLNLGRALVAQGGYRNAIRYFEQARHLSADDDVCVAALLNEGLCYLNLIELDQADRIFEEGQKLAADPGIFLYHRGRVAMAREDYPGAAKLFDGALAIDSKGVPKDDLLFNLAVSSVNIGDTGEALGYLERIKEISPPVRFYQGICWYSMGYMEAALGSFQQALDMGPSPEDLGRVLFYIGSSLKELGRYEEAIDVLDEAVQADPSEYASHNLRGFCFFQLRQHRKSIEAFKKAIEINPRSAIDYASIGSNLRELGNLEEAVAMYEMALSIDPALTFAAENIKKLREAQNG